MNWLTTVLRKAIAMTLLFSTGSALADGGQAPLVRVTQGQISGVQDGAAHVYRAIPYAAPPVGNLRWRAPQPAAAWRGIRDGSSFAPNCGMTRPGPPPDMLPYTSEFNAPGPASEDCLYLNIWGPADKASLDLPVMVWIHGGGFQGGGSTSPLFNGSRLAAKGAVIVTINYRLGPLGFLAHPDLAKESLLGTSGNYGLLDIVAALRWVQENISGFGGDSSKVTLFGQSAGGMAINALLMAPMAKSLFHGAIIQSGVTTGWLSSADKAQADGVALAAAAGAPSIAALRKLSVAQLLAATANMPARTEKPLMVRFIPNLDGKIVTADPMQPRGDPQIAVPIIAGFNRDEGEGSTLGEQVSPEAFEARVRAKYGEYADRLLALYPHGSDEDASHSAYLLPRDQAMAALILWSSAREAKTGQPVYAYAFNHVYPGPSAEAFGSFHSSEVPYVFGQLISPQRVFSERDHAIVEDVQTAWLQFARTGRLDWPHGVTAERDITTIGSLKRPNTPVSSAERLSLFKAMFGQGLLPPIIKAR